MTPDSGRQVWLYKLKVLSGNRMGGSEAPQAPNTPTTDTLTHTPLSQTGRIIELDVLSAGWPLGYEAHKM